MPSSPLESRLSASVAASLTLLQLCTTILSPALALAADSSDVRAIPSDGLMLGASDVRAPPDLDISYQPDFAALDRSLAGRAVDTINILGNRDPKRFTIEPGMTAYFALSLDELSARREPATSRREIQPHEDLDRETLADSGSTDRSPSGHSLPTRQFASRTVFVSANTCRQPQRAQGPKSDGEQPQLRLVISSDATDEYPQSDKPSAETAIFIEGAATQRITVTTSVAYFSIEAPPVSDDFTGQWNFEIAASTNGWYHSYLGEEGDGMLWTAGLDGTSALLMTKNLTESTRDAQAMMQSEPPYTLFVDSVDSRRLDGVRRSYCGLETYAQIASLRHNRPTKQVSMTMTTRGLGQLPKQQFWFDGLNSSTLYTGILVRNRPHAKLSRRQEDGSDPDTIEVFPEVEFETTAGTNCRVITDLEFCNEVEYAVPANDVKFNSTTALATAYDDFAKTMYGNFEKVMMQMACEVPNSSKYSLVRDCADCKNAYKNWLCSVAIPRCEDLTSDNPHAALRNLAQSFPNGTSVDAGAFPETQGDGTKHFGHMGSRNRWITETIEPGPYREVLPCDDLCYNVVQSCPAAMGFSCPLPEDRQFAGSYARRTDDPRSCNFPISATFRSGSAVRGAPWLVAAVAMSIFSVMTYI